MILEENKIKKIMTIVRKYMHKLLIILSKE